MRWPLVAALVLSLVGCGGALAEGEADFRQGRYPAAKEAFEALEIEMRSGDGPTRAEYALYRGLTFAALGDLSRAVLWLREAKRLEDARGGTLRADDARRLAVALEANEIL